MIQTFVARAEVINLLSQHGAVYKGERFVCVVHFTLPILIIVANLQVLRFTEELLRKVNYSLDLVSICSE